MLILKISKRVPESMISQLNNLLKFPPITEKRLALQSHTPFFLSLRRIQIKCFHSSGPVRCPKVALVESPLPISSSVIKISRVARSDAQAALFEYLHYTRGFTYMDAEHISKNSPHFVENLVMKVENEQDVSRALSKLLRYYPINEFEPFLESLGLRPTELSLFLPANLIFLADDHMLLDNFHVLCDYGIPRVEIGKIYKEAAEIFGYEFGRLNTKLRAYEDLGLSKPTVIKLVTSCPSILVGDVNKELVDVLNKLTELGFQRDWIGGYLSSRHSYSWNRMLDTMTFLVEVGFGDMQIGDLIRKNPAFLLEGSGKQIYVLFGRLLKLGLKMNEVYLLLLENPEILSPKCAKNVWKALYFLFEIGMETDHIAKFLRTHIQLLASHSLKGPKTVLRSLNGDRQKLLQVMSENPSKFFALAFKSNISSIEQIRAKNPGKMLQKTAFLLKLGYIENSDEMGKALKKFRGRGDQLQERFDCLVQAGLDSNVVVDMIRQAPTALNQSKDVLEKKIAYLISLGYPIESVAAFPTYLCYDIGRINRRFNMYLWLKERGAVKSMISPSTLLACSEARFTKYFVDVHPEGPLKWESLKKSSLSS